MTKKGNSPQIYGNVEKGFEKVRDAFIHNFSKLGETGAACAVYVQGRLVVDLWGGYSDLEHLTEWRSDTLVPVFSSTKGFAALAAAIAHSRGYFAYDDPLVKYWPEFGTYGKESITIRQLLAHQAGLSHLDEFQLESFRDLDTANISSQLASMKPSWKPGTIHGYHTWTIGWFISEMIRRTDPKKRTLGVFLHEEIAKPLQVEFYIGLPDEIPDSRLAKVKGFNSPLQLLFKLHQVPKPLLLGFANPRSLTSRSMVDKHRLVANNNFNNREMLSIEFPSGNGVGRVQGMAKIYGEFASGGSMLRIAASTLEELKKPAVAPANGWFDHVNRADLGYSLGFWKPIDTRRFGSSLTAYGHPGAGGSFCFADPDIGLGYAYAMNQIGGYMDKNPRENALRKALYSCL